jgi:murein DD-endopeptidase MepM/ murein hydrolase activator NlpD
LRRKVQSPTLDDCRSTGPVQKERIVDRGLGTRRAGRVLALFAGAWLSVAHAGAAPTSAASESWVAPLPPPLGLTGTPGEYRTGHLHGGVDFSTGGKTGVPVRAVRAGWIVRVRVSGSGYGRALHLRTVDGDEIVYGHLERFAPALAAYARDGQRAAGEYEVDLTPEAGRFEVAAGDTIAWSGESGAGPPHLHLEARSNGLVANALAHGLRAPDGRPPQLGPAGLRALAADAWVDDGIVTRCAPPALPRVWGRVGVECRAVDPTVNTASRLAPLEIDLTLDGATVFTRCFAHFSIGAGPEVRRVYGTLFDADGPWSYRLYHWPAGDEADATEIEGESGVIDFSVMPPGRHRLCVEATDASGASADLAWDVEVRPPLLVSEWRAAPDGAGGRLLGLRLRAPFDSLRLPLRLQAMDAPGPRGKPRAGWVESGEWLALGDGWLCARAAGGGTVRVVDRTGRVLLPPIRLAAERGRPASLPAASVRTRIDEGMAVLEVVAPAGLPGLPRARLETGSGPPVALLLRGAGENGGWEFALDHGALAGEAKSLTLEFGPDRAPLSIPVPGLIGVGPKTGVGPIRCLADRLTLIPAVDSFYGGAILQVTGAGPGDSAWTAQFGRAGQVARGLKALSPIFTLSPADRPLGGPVEVRVSPAALTAAVDASAPQWGLYRLAGRGWWRWIGRESGAEGLGATVVELGRYALLEDTAAPEIRDASPAEGERRREPPAVLRVRASDLGSGFDPREADIDLDGAPLLAVWDVDEGTLSATPERLGPGAHEWAVRITDRAGNRAVERYRFTVTGP